MDVKINGMQIRGIVCQVVASFCIFLAIASVLGAVIMGFVYFPILFFTGLVAFLVTQFIWFFQK